MFYYVMLKDLREDKDITQDFISTEKIKETRRNDEGAVPYIKQ